MSGSETQKQQTRDAPPRCIAYHFNWTLADFGLEQAEIAMTVITQADG